MSAKKWLPFKSREEYLQLPFSIQSPWRKYDHIATLVWRDKQDQVEMHIYALEYADSYKVSVVIRNKHLIEEDAWGFKDFESLQQKLPNTDLTLIKDKIKKIDMQRVARRV